MKNRIPSIKTLLAALLAASIGLTSGYWPPIAAVEPEPAAPIVAEGCAVSAAVTSIERVETGLTSETFLVKWSASSPCITGFEVRVEATRQNNEVRNDEKKFGAGERSGLLKVFGSRSDNKAKSVRAIVTARGVLAGKGTGSLGQTVVATEQPATATKPTFAIFGTVMDDDRREISDVRLIFSAVSGKGVSIPQTTTTVGSAAPSDNTVIPRAVQTDSRGAYRQTGFPFGQSFKVTPSKPGFTFAPASSVVAIVNADVRTDFRAIPPQTFVAFGQVRAQNGGGIADATITFNFANPADGQKAFLPSPVKSAANGRWGQSGFSSGIRYTATVSKFGVTFKPNTLTFDTAAGNLDFFSNP